MIRTDTHRPLVIDQRQRGEYQPWIRMTDAQKAWHDAPFSEDDDPTGQRFFRGARNAVVLTFVFVTVTGLFWAAVLS